MERTENIDFLKSSDLSELTADVVCDHSLPDYKGEVKRVLYTSASVVPSGKYIDNTELTFSGIVVYNVVYLNNENSIEGAEFTADYDFSLKCPTSHAVDFYEKVRVCSFSVRLTGPRKFNARCTLAATVSVLEEVSLPVEYDIGENAVELSKQTAGVMCRRSYSLRDREYAEKLLLLDGVIADDVNIITSSAYVDVESVSIIGEEVNVRGNIKIDFVLSSADVPPYSEHKSIPFDELISTDASGDVTSFDAGGTVTSLKLTVNPDDFGSDIVADVIADFNIESKENSEITVASDAYLVTCDSTADFENFTYTEFCGTESKFEHFESKIRAEEIELSGVREIVYTGAVCKIDECVMTERGADIRGEIRFSGIAGASNEENEILHCGFKYNAPMSINVNIDCQNLSNMRLEPKIKISNTEALIDRDMISFCCDIKAEVSSYNTKSIKRVIGLSLLPDTEYKKSPSKITVYYPDKGESLFSVAKKFHTTVREIAVTNSLTESVINSLDNNESMPKRLIIK